MERSATGALFGAGGVALLASRRREKSAAREARNAAGLYCTAFLMPTRKDLARWLVHAADKKIPLSGFADHLVSEVRLSGRPRRQRHRGLRGSRARDLEMGRRLGRRWLPTSSTSTACWR